MFTTFNIKFSEAQGQITRVGGGIWPKFELIQAFMHVRVSCKNEDDSIKNEVARVVTIFSHYKSMGIFSRRSRAANSAVLDPIWPNFELILDVIDVLVTCKNKELFYQKKKKKMKALKWSQDFPHYIEDI